ncbi:MAG: ABC transporter substrate-binding protein [Reyranellaceae bacterium]
MVRHAPSRRAVLGGGIAMGVAALARPTLSQTKEKWRHGMVQAKGDSGFFYMAQKKGMLERRGIELEMLEFKGGKDVMRGLLASELDSADMQAVETLQAVEKGAKLRFIGSSIIGYPYALYVRPEIASWQELADKRFGISAPGSTPHVMALAMLHAKGVSAEKVQFMNAGGSASRIKALAAGRLDAVPASSEFIPMAQDLGVKVMIHSRDIVPQFPRFFVVAGAEVLAKRPDAAARFLAGYMEGLRFCADNRQEAIDLSSTIDGGSEGDRYAYIYDEVMSNKLLSLNMEIPADRILWVRDMMIELGELKEKIAIEPLIDGKHREAALKLAGPRQS